MTTTKKFLSIILAILMLVTSVPVVFAATSGDFEYRITAGVAVITGYNGDGGALEFPATIEGYPVSVKSFVFKNNNDITSLTFYGDVAFNESYIFYECTNLTTVTFYGDVAFNEAYPFYNCTNLTDFIFIDNVTVNATNFQFFASSDKHSVNVHFCGTENEWKTFIDSIGYNDCPVKNATPYYCTEKDKVEATCTADGFESGWYCDDCEKYIAGGEAIPASHDIIIDEAVAPKCGETGLTAGQHCSRCDDMTVAQEEIPALGHADEDGDNICDNGCGTQISSGGDGGTGKAETPDEPAEDTCDRCGEVHANFFRNFICMLKDFFNRIMNFFTVLFK